MNGLIRNADLVVLVADLGAEKMIEDLQLIVDLLKEKRIILKKDNSENPDDVRLSFKPTIICAHKEYEDEDGAKQAILAEKFPEFKMAATSILDDDSLDLFKKLIYESLGIIRVYTKPVGHDPDYKDPIILPVGGTVEEAAISLHKDFVKKLKFAKIWGEGKFDGQRVQSDFVLSDKDIIEFHM